MTPIITGDHIRWKLLATRIVAALRTTVGSDWRPGNVILVCYGTMKLCGNLIFVHLPFFFAYRRRIAELARLVCKHLAARFSAGRLSFVNCLMVDR
jgi:hypothetical protein